MSDSHSWGSRLDYILEAPNPVQAYFTWQNQSRDHWSLDCVGDEYEESRCTYDCANISAIVSTTTPIDTLWQCAIYPNVTNAFRQGNLSEPEQAFLHTDNVDTSLTKAATVTSTLSSCLSAYCESLEGCKQASPAAICLAASLTINGTMLNRDTTETCIQAICASHPQPLANSDIAGIGIVSSYIMQIGIVLLSALTLVILQHWQKRDSRGMRMSYSNPNHTAYEPHNGAESLEFENPNPRQGGGAGTDTRQGFLTQESSEFQQQPPTFHEKLPKMTDVYGCLIVALIDFLKAQCFSAIAVSVASLIVLHSQSQTSLLDTTALGAASGISIVPIAFNYYILAIFNNDKNDPERKSLFLYGLAFCSWVLGFAVVFDPQMLKANQQNKIGGTGDTAVFNSQFPNSCGNASPETICPGLYKEGLHPEYTFYYTLCLPIIIGLTLWQLSTIPSVSRVLSAVFYTNSKPRLPLFTLMHLIAQGCFIASFSFFFDSLADLLGSDAVSFEWSFGQIVAITLYMPSILGFFHSLWYGVEKAQKKQQAVGYTTIKT